jgi:hypothetical protein
MKTVCRNKFLFTRKMFEVDTHTLLQLLNAHTIENLFKTICHNSFRKCRRAIMFLLFTKETVLAPLTRRTEIHTINSWNVFISFFTVPSYSRPPVNTNRYKSFLSLFSFFFLLFLLSSFFYYISFTLELPGQKQISIVKSESHCGRLIS